MRDKAAPDNYAALYQVGRLAATSGQYLDRGLVSLRRSLEFAVPDNTPGHPAAQWRIGNILERKNDPAGARAAYPPSVTTRQEQPFVRGDLAGIPVRQIVGSAR